MRLHHLNCMSSCPLGGRREYGGSLTVCCGHDPSEFERLSGRSPEIPAVPRLAWPEAARAMEA